MDRTARRISYVFLCTLPFLAAVVVGVRALRIAGVNQAIGGILFAVILIAAWILGARRIALWVAGSMPWRFLRSTTCPPTNWLQRH
jgi:spore maturation protein SpmB